MILLLKYFIAFIVVFLCSWIPLIGAYDYEASVCTALLGLVFIPILIPESPKDARTGLIKTLGSIIGFWIIANAGILLVTLIKNELCSFESGLTYQLLISLPSNLLAGLFWGWIAHLTDRKYIRIPVYIFILLLDFGFAIYALYNWPPLIAFGQFFGYFAGSIYDEAIDVFKSLAFYRIGSLALILCLCYAQTSKAHISRRILLPVIGISLAAGYHIFLAYTEILPPMGRSQIQSVLWQTVSSPENHFTVHFLPKSKNRSEIREESARIYKEYSSDYRYLSEFFGNTPPQPIDIWLYPDSKLKGKYIGAERTSFARVWKNELHLVSTPPDATLARHEMAHLFASSFGNSPFGLAGSHHIPAMGWIEGLAMAAEWPIEMYDLHTWSQAILDHPETFGNITPHQILYGFWGLPSRVAYTLAGSYVRYLIDQFGMDKVKQLSNLMPGDYEDIIGSDFDTIFEQWKSWLNQNAKSNKAIDLAPVVFGSASIFDKHCARNQAKLNAEYTKCLNNSFCSLLELQYLSTTKPDAGCIFDDCTLSQNDFDIQTLERYYRLYMISGPLETTNAVPDAPSGFTASHLRTVIFSQLTEDNYQQMPPAARLIWLERSADMMWHSKLYQPAAILYQTLSQMYLPETMARRIEIKLQACTYPEDYVSIKIQQWFTSNHPEDALLIPAQNPEVPILSYLDFINSMNRRDFKRALDAWTRIIIYHDDPVPAHQIPSKAWGELIRLAVFL